MIFKKIIYILLIINNFNIFATTKIDVIVPLQHNAMDEIVKGFKENLSSNTEIKVHNAMGDINLLQSIIRQINLSKTDFIVPVGTQTSQMTANLLDSKKSIIGLAATMSKKELLTRKEFSIVVDEIPMRKILEFIKQAFPQFKKIAIIRSDDHKTEKQVQEVKKLASQFSIKIQELVANAHYDIPVLMASISSGSDAVLILKDHLIVSSIALIYQKCKVRSLPLFSLDEGSVNGGACLALGVREHDIGKKGAELLLKKINSSKTEKIISMKKLNLFYKKSHCLEKTVKHEKIILDSATNLGHKIIRM